MTGNFLIRLLYRLAIGRLKAAVGDRPHVAATCPGTNESNAMLPSLPDAQSGSVNKACQ